jgi:daunorubicin resistance ABC transporter ATP-binding subunit
MPEYAIVADKVERTFKEGEVKALDGVSLNVPVGQVFGLLGPNGSGKTTMVRILSTILKPTAGSVEILGHDVVREPEKVRPLIGLAGQFATVDENLTGFENLRMMGRLNHLEASVITKRCHELLEQFGLSDAGGRSAKTYSGGMRRRLDLAAALVASPPLLFLDEPTTGLDPQSRQDLWAVIESLVESGTTVFLTTQYLEEADRLAKQLVVLDHGRIIAEGTPAELKAMLGTTVLALTFASSNDATHGADLVRDLSSKALNLDGTVVELTVNSGPTAAADALRLIDGAGLTLTGLALREPSLDDVFLSLTGHKAEDAELLDAVPANVKNRGARV